MNRRHIPREPGAGFPPAPSLPGGFARSRALALILLSTGWLQAQPAPSVVVRVFTLKYRRVEEAALLVRPLLSENGSVLLESKHNTLTVRDSAAAVERSAGAIASYDLPPRALSISITLLKASSEPSPKSTSRNVSEEVRTVGERLKKLFKYSGYSPLDSVVVEGEEGDTVAYPIGGEYRLKFLLDPSADVSIVKLKGLTLERVRKGLFGKEVWREVLKTSINIPMGQPFILGIGRDEAASGALFLVFHAGLPGPGPGIVGIR